MFYGKGFMVGLHHGEWTFLPNCGIVRDNGLVNEGVEVWEGNGQNC